MNWYYDDNSVTEFHSQRMRNKTLAYLRKIKKKKQELRQKKLARDKIRLERRLAKEKALEQIKKDKEAKKKEFYETIKDYGYKKGYTNSNPLKARKNQRDLKICQELYEKNKQGISRFKLAIEYNMTPISVTRYIYEYEYYLNVKSAGQEVKDLLQ